MNTTKDERPERDAFEVAMARLGYHQPPSLYRDGTYRDTCYSAGWDAWQAATAAARESAALVRRPLTDSQISNRLWEADWPESMLSDFVRAKLVALVRSVERAHGIHAA
jgi:hypothetical protein